MSKTDEVVFYLIYVENMKNKWKWMMVAGLVPAEGRLAVVAPCRPSLRPENFHAMKPSWVATEFSPCRARWSCFVP